MPTVDLKIACQRCGEPMEMKDPAPDEAWRPDQFWVCRRCGRHFWSTYATPPAAASAASTKP
jgi:DNA-directed RNA polymerase subunit RPC12/RpoP